jgi:hypothetical protein
MGEASALAHPVRASISRVFVRREPHFKFTAASKTWTTVFHHRPPLYGCRRVLAHACMQTGAAVDAVIVIIIIVAIVVVFYLKQFVRAARLAGN